MMARPLLTAALLLASLAAPLPARAADKVVITGDSFVVDDAKHQAVFTGNVVVTQAQMKLTADKVVAYYGSGGASNITSVEALAHVKIVNPTETAVGERAVYDPKARLLRLTGNVVVNNATGQVQGAELVIDLNKNTSVFTGNKKGGRVTGVFTPQ